MSTPSHSNRQALRKSVQAKVSPPWRSGLFWLQAALIVVLGAAIYSPVFQGEFLWDDDTALTGNVAVQDPNGLYTIWFKPSNDDYYPLKDSVQWFQWHFWHADPTGYHLTNIVLHLFSALLIWRIFARLGIRFAWLGGLLFAVHPLMVESVAWIAEIKNTLSLPFLLLAIDTYLEYEERPRWGPYLLSALFFIASLLSKTSSIMFPAVILLYGWWRHGRIRREDVKTSLPFFGISLLLGVVTIWFQHVRAMGREAVDMGGFVSQVACAAMSLAFYIWKFICPVGLLPIYPQWDIQALMPLEFLLWLFYFILIFWLWTKRKSWGRHALFGIGFFVLNLLPVIGLVTVAWGRFSWVADHFTYVAPIGLIGITVAAVADLQERLPRLRPLIVGIVALVIAFFSYQSYSYARIFHDSPTLWTYSLEHNPEGWVAHANLGRAYLNSGQIEEAVEELRKVLPYRANTSSAHCSLAIALHQMGSNDEALREYELAVQLDPLNQSAHYNLGNILVEMHRMPEAIEHYQASARIDPKAVGVHYNLALALRQTGRLDEAMEQDEIILRLNPTFAEANNNLGNILAQKGRWMEAVEQYRAALRSRPDFPQAQRNLENALMHAYPNP